MAKKSYSKAALLFHLLMTFLTGGLWLIFLGIRYVISK